MLKVYHIGKSWLVAEPPKYSILQVDKHRIKTDHDSQSFVLGEKPKKINTVSITSVVDYAEDSLGNRLNRDEYLDLREEVYQGKTEDGAWESLDAEFRYRKFLETWTVVNKTIETLTPVEFEIIELDKEEIVPYSLPMRFFTSKTSDSHLGLYRYVPNRFEMLCDIGKELGAIYVAEKDLYKPDRKATYLPPGSFYWSYPSRGCNDLRFIKVGNNYTDYKKLDSLRDCVGTLEECAEAHRQNISTIQSFWRTERAKYSEREMSGSHKDRIRTELNSILVLTEELNKDNCLQDGDGNPLSLLKQRVNTALGVLDLEG